MKRCLWVFALFIVSLAGCDEKAPDQQAIETEAAPQVIADPEMGKLLIGLCKECHGPNGVNGKSGVPFIAGQQQDYLVTVMQAYKKGTRKNEAMKKVLESLNDKDMLDIAAYYSSLAAKWTEKVDKKSGTPTVSKRVIAAGKAISTPCGSCHGKNGNSNNSGVPSLALLEPEYFIAAMDEYLTEKRDDPYMKYFRHSLTSRDIKNLAAYYTGQTPKKMPLPSSGRAAAGKKVAKKMCAGCHGIDGNSFNPGFPSLAGQNAGYLVKAIKAYKTGQRKNALMNKAVAKLSNKTINNLAAFFAAQHPKKMPKPDLQAKGFDPIGDGKRIASGCAGCHGEQGNSSSSGIPSLSGLHSDYLVAAIKAYQDGTRKSDIMKTFVSSLNGDDIEKVSLYYATVEPGRNTKPGKGDSSTGEKLTGSCSGCHGEHGNSSQPATPSLAGQDPEYLVSAIQAYAGGKRSHENMQNAVKVLTKDQMLDIAAYYSTQSIAKPEIKLPEAPEVLAQKCDRCHGENGYSTDATKPRLAGQVETYLQKALFAYKDGARTSKFMHAMSDVLSRLEIKAIAEYYAQMKN